MENHTASRCAFLADLSGLAAMRLSALACQRSEAAGKVPNAVAASGAQAVGPMAAGPAIRATQPVRDGMHGTGARFGLALMYCDLTNVNRLPWRRDLLGWLRDQGRRRLTPRAGATRSGWRSIGAHLETWPAGGATKRPDNCHGHGTATTDPDDEPRSIQSVRILRCFPDGFSATSGTPARSRR